MGVRADPADLGGGYAVGGRLNFNEGWRLREPYFRERDEQERMACRPSDLCIQCDIPMQPTSGGKRQCRKCGALQTCCDNP